MHRAASLLLLVGAVAVAALAGSLSTLDAAGQYAALEQPPWAPPPWLFGPVWTALYLAMAVAAWRVEARVGLRSRELALFGAQLAANALWSPLFFAWDLRGVALAWILVLDLLVAATTWAFWRRDRVAGGLLLPYLAWVLFATGLNAAVWWLNR